MREIKFRAWHNGSPKGRSTIPAQMIYDKNPGDCLRWKNDGQDTEEVMQYAGVKDRNGTEIYEGDIVRTSYPEGKTRVGKVIFQDFRLCWAVELNPHANNDLFRCLNYGPVTEVIGNIHENPELLTQPDK